MFTFTRFHRTMSRDDELNALNSNFAQVENESAKPKEKLDATVWREVARLDYENLGSTPISLDLPEGYKYFRIENRLIQDTTNATASAFRIRFNNNTGSVYPRRYTRWTNAGAPNVLNSTETSIILGITGGVGQQSYAAIEGIADGSFGWPRMTWDMIGDSTEWSYGFGQVRYDVTEQLTSIQMYQDIHTVHGTLIVYGRN